MSLTDLADAACRDGADDALAAGKGRELRHLLAEAGDRPEAIAVLVEQQDQAVSCDDQVTGLLQRHRRHSTSSRAVSFSVKLWIRLISR
jgi:hypothetical protein